VTAQKPVHGAVDFYVCDACGYHYMEAGITCDCFGGEKPTCELRHVRMVPEQPAAAQGAVAWQVGDEFYPSESLAIEAIQQWGPSGAIAIPLYAAAPVTAAPVEPKSPSYDGLLLMMQSVCGALSRAGLTDCDDPGEAIDVIRERLEKRVAKLERQLLASTPAAPGIDLEQFREPVEYFRDAFAAQSLGPDSWHAVKVAEADRLLAMIDASPRSTNPRTPIDGCTESNCPRCRTHPDHRGDMEHAGIGRRPPQGSPKGGSEARDAVVVEGVIEFRRSSTSEPKLCVCCPGEPSHIFGRSVNWEGECWAQFNALETAICKHFTYKNENEGRRLRVTIEVVQAQASDAEVWP